MQFQIENGQAVVQSVLAALLPYHLTMKKEWELDDELMPPVTSVEDFRKQIGLSQVHVLEHEVDGMAYIGLELGCEWEDEHGLGIVVRGSRVVEIGEADIAFCWRPDEPATNQEVS